jgi:hypothetical protein
LLERGTVEFYRQEAARISHLAESVANTSLRLEMLDIAAGFLKLAEHAIVRNAARELKAPETKSA